PRLLDAVDREVPDVGGLDALLSRDRAVLLERLDGSPGELHHLVVRMEPEEMDWRVRTEVVVHPLRKLPRGPEIVADLGHDEVRDLDVDLLCVAGVENRLEDRLRVRDVDVLANDVGLSGSFAIYLATFV